MWQGAVAVAGTQNSCGVISLVITDELNIHSLFTAASTWWKDPFKKSGAIDRSSIETGNYLYREWIKETKQCPLILSWTGSSSYLILYPVPDLHCRAVDLANRNHWGILQYYYFIVGQSADLILAAYYELQRLFKSYPQLLACNLLDC